MHTIAKTNSFSWSWPFGIDLKGFFYSSFSLYASVKVLVVSLYLFEWNVFFSVFFSMQFVGLWADLSSFVFNILPMRLGTVLWFFICNIFPLRHIFKFLWTLFVMIVIAQNNLNVCSIWCCMCFRSKSKNCWWLSISSCVCDVFGLIPFVGLLLLVLIV